MDLLHYEGLHLSILSTVIWNGLADPLHGDQNYLFQMLDAGICEYKMPASYRSECHIPIRLGMDNLVFNYLPHNSYVFDRKPYLPEEFH